MYVIIQGYNTPTTCGCQQINTCMPAQFLPFPAARRGKIFSGKTKKLLTRASPSCIIHFAFWRRSSVGQSIRFIPEVSPVRIQSPLPCVNLPLRQVYLYGPLVKWLRHRPFTAVTRVRVSYGSPYGGVAQPVEHLLHTQGVTDSSSVVSTRERHLLRQVSFFLLRRV